MSDLRTRIAAVLADADGIPWDMWSKPSQDDASLFRADAVIHELGLEIERGGTYAIGGEATSHRYVTDWKSDD